MAGGAPSLPTGGYGAAAAVAHRHAFGVPGADTQPLRWRPRAAAAPEFGF